MTSLRTIACIIGTAIIPTLSGCAKFPAAGQTVTGNRLIITLKVRGRISPVDDADPSIRRYYFIAIDNDGNPQTGPIAPLYPPYGNGWVTSANADQSTGLTSFVEYDALNPRGNVYPVIPGTFFLRTDIPQPPIQYQLADGGSTLQFVVDFGQIATDAFPAEAIRQLDINFITTNSIEKSDSVIPDREWDALGPSGQNYVPVDTTLARRYQGTNSDGPPVTDPDLDIVFWSIEVQPVASQ